jgi:hypothetical protein
MRNFTEKLVIGGFGAALMVWGFAPPATALPSASQAVDTSTLGPAEQMQAVTTPIGDTGPLGQPADGQCRWSRIQVPGAQGLQWEAIESCSDIGN